jgi:hypothetical protein
VKILLTLVLTLLVGAASAEGQSALPAIVAATGSAHSGVVDVSTLTDWCLLGMPANALVGVGYCKGYIRGVVDGADMNRMLNHLPQCIPDNETDNQLVDLFLNYENKHHAEDKDKPASWALILALSETFSCGGGK